MAFLACAYEYPALILASTLLIIYLCVQRTPLPAVSPDQVLSSCHVTSYFRPN